MEVAYMKLELKAIHKEYPTTKALDDFSIEMEEGVYGLLGPNGSGKSTLISILTGNLKADSGEVIWNGKDVAELGADFYSLIGYVPQQLAVYPSFTTRQYYTYIGALKGVEKGLLQQQIAQILELVELENVADHKIATYSEGMKRRALIGQALLGNPQILLFDEPTAGLDPGQRIAVREIIKEQAKERIVLVATHIVADVETIARELIFVRKGKLIAHGSPQEILSMTGQNPQDSIEEAYLYFFPEHVKGFKA